MRVAKIIVKTEFDAMHHWKNCDIPAVDFLKHPHRHKFYVTAKFKVSHDDRDLEFFLVKSKLDDIISTLYPIEGPLNIRNLGSRSCEMVCQDIIDAFLEMPISQTSPHFEWMLCSVFEDNENGAEVIWIAES